MSKRKALLFVLNLAKKSDLVKNAFEKLKTIDANPYLGFPDLIVPMI